MAQVSKKSFITRKKDGIIRRANYVQDKYITNSEVQYI
jgi:hypothetical protein